MSRPIASIPISRSGSSDTHIDIHVDYEKADRRNSAGVQMKLYPVRHEGDFVTHTLSYGFSEFPRTLVQAMPKNFKAKVESVRNRIMEEFESERGEWYMHAMTLIRDAGYTITRDDEVVGALAGEHEEACYEDEGEAAYGRPE